MEQENLGQEDERSEEQKRLEYIRQNAEKRDVSYDLNKWFRHRIQDGDPELLDIQRQGYITEARNWLQSSTPEGMKYGNASKEQRITYAQKFADLAKINLEDL